MTPQYMLGTANHSQSPGPMLMFIEQKLLFSWCPVTEGGRRGRGEEKEGGREGERGEGRRKGGREEGGEGGKGGRGEGGREDGKGKFEE